MATFVCINDLSSHVDEALNPKLFIEKRVSGDQITGLFFYSDSVTELFNMDRSNLWIEYAKSVNIPIYACRNSLVSRNISDQINPFIKIVGLGQLIEGVVFNEKTLVIGKL